jgi:hypothetical protein
MTHLEVVLRGHAGAIAWRTVQLREGLVLGDAPEAEFAFPGAVLVVRRDRLGWTLDGHRLLVDKPLVFAFGGFEVRIAPVAEVVSGVEARPWLDPRLLVPLAALLLFGSTLAAAERVAANHPAVTQQLVSRVLGPPAAVEAGVELPPKAPGAPGDAAAASSEGRADPAPVE